MNNIFKTIMYMWLYIFITAKLDRKIQKSPFERANIPQFVLSYNEQYVNS